MSEFLSHPREMLEQVPGWLGVDVGWVFPAVDSDGRIYRWASPAKRRSAYHDREHTQAGAVTVRRADGSVSVHEPYRPDQLADIQARARNEDYRRRLRTICRQVVAAARAKGWGLVLEDWSDFSGRQTKWTDVYEGIVRVAQELGVPLRTTDRAWTSVTCPKCGFLNKANRKSRDTFECLHCGTTGQADFVAAVNLQQRAEKGEKLHFDLPGMCSNPACIADPWTDGRCVRCYFFARRKGRHPTEEEIARLVISLNRREFEAMNAEAMGLIGPKPPSSEARKARLLSERTYARLAQENQEKIDQHDALMARARMPD